MSAPEDWINEQVAIGISGAKPQLIIGELLEVSDRGVTISVPVGVSSATVFYPWGMVEMVQLESSANNDSPSDEQLARRIEELGD
ncbi:MAG: hypothetical protein M3N45_01850 [Actinomycetota bacterium]|nr:hypothetical protein [Actinomycetota bacterium]